MEISYEGSRAIECSGTFFVLRNMIH